MVKKVHLGEDEARAKIEKLEKELQSSQIQQNKTKRRRVYAQLVQVRKALANPPDLLVDPRIGQLKREQDIQRRIHKKMEQKQATLKTLKNQKRHQKRCLKCGSRQHLLQNCIQVQTGYCFKCGSSQHTHTECTTEGYRFANCFHCGNSGHIARQCPQNDKGLYRKGGSCFGCGSVRHTIKDCPNKIKGVGVFKNQEDF